MNKNLSRLISDYQESVLNAVNLLLRSGIEIPLTNKDWVEYKIPAHGELEDGAKYFKHGYGCTVYLPSGSVDFDFGSLGEIGGFDIWRLTNFAEKKLIEYGFKNEEELEKVFMAAVNSGELSYSGYLLYYVKGASRSLKIDKNIFFYKNQLPHRDQDPVLALYAHYYCAADLMFKNYSRLSEKWRKDGHLSRGNKVKAGIYQSSWLGFLFTTCEGFQKLSMRKMLETNRPSDFLELMPKTDIIGKMMKQHYQALRALRNDIFHLRDNINEIQNFFAREEERLIWAKNLHAAFAEFFSEYRILCEVHYAIQGRNISAKN
ncbi:DUF6896 domain-containing protein [Chromobacterium violaceum]|uniref:DUF6896 domain-containing protein n=1 Tax=Chromobacterium violaceum TaxID=536 RepID=UPI001B2FEC5F|nr:hypothetical protein [Chromobacterium violaceum]